MYDLAIIGGGINGCGIARDAAGRGYSVFLAEQGDLASGTSSGSTKLIHGGLRYLEHGAFRLVREALLEREVLWGMAPHVVWPLRFVLPHDTGMRPAWLLRLGLCLYDHLGGRRRLPATRVIDLRTDPAGKALAPRLETAFEYSDCWVDDARLVILNARDAAARGAEVRTRTRVERIAEADGHWRVETCDVLTGAPEAVTARIVINASGPWVDDVSGRIAGRDKRRHVRLVKGSHIVVRRLYDHDRAYIFQNKDRRVIFAIPYEQDFTLIGTTDEDFQGDPGGAEISNDECAYLCEAASAYLRQPVKPQDVVWTYAGVRPLYDDGASAAQEATRDYVVRRSVVKQGGAAVISVFGGKITTYRRLAESVLTEVDAALGRGTLPWTAGAALPGGAFGIDGLADLRQAAHVRYPFLGEATLLRLVRTYGRDLYDVIGDARSQADLGRDFGAGLSEREVLYLQTREWARTSDDVLWRRTKLGLRLSRDQQAALERWLEASSRITKAVDDRGERR